MMAYIFDIVIVGMLVFFAWRGGARGLILSLCGLAAVFVAFFAAQFVSDTFCAPVANILRPVIINSFQRVEPEQEPPKGQPGQKEDGEEEQEGPTYTLEELMESVRENGLFKGFSAFMEEGVENDAVEKAGGESPLDALASYLSKGMAKTLLFAIVFLGVQLAWFLVSHALDLAFKLPILAQVNFLGGLVIGLAKGILLIIVLVWLGQLAGVVPSEPDTPVLSLFTVERLGGLLERLPG